MVEKPIDWFVRIFFQDKDIYLSEYKVLKPKKKQLQHYNPTRGTHTIFRTFTLIVKYIYYTEMI